MKAKKINEIIKNVYTLYMDQMIFADFLKLHLQFMLKRMFGSSFHNEIDL